MNKKSSVLDLAKLVLLACIAGILFGIYEELRSIPRYKDVHAEKYKHGHLAETKPKNVPYYRWNSPLTWVAGGDVEILGDVDVKGEVEVEGIVEVKQSWDNPVPVKVRK